MKRWFVLLLILVLALHGCHLGPDDGTTTGTQPQNTTQQPTTLPPIDLTVTDSSLQKQTNGAVLPFAPENGGITGVGFMGADAVMLSCDGEKTTLTRFSAEDGTVKAQTQRSGIIETQSGSVGMNENRLAYYDASQNCYVILDGSFREVDQIKMPEGLTGSPVLSADLGTAYFCTGAEIRAMDLVDGLPRMVCQLNVQAVSVTGLLFGDSMLQCSVTDTHGRSSTVFYSTQTGQNLGSDETLMTIADWENSYLVRRLDGPVTEVLVGEQEGTLQAFSPYDVHNELAVLPGLGNVLEIGYTQTGAALTLYELTKGCCTAAVTLDGVLSVRSPIADPSGKYIWFIGQDPDTGSDLLCRWDYACSGGADKTVRIGTRYGAENPDTAGLAECELLAEALEEKYYVEILMNSEVVEPEDYSFVQEYQVPAYKQALQDLDTALAKYPEGFFRSVASVSNSPKLYISLIRGMTPNSYDIPAPTEGLQYWINGSAYMAVTMGDKVEQTFYHELCHVLDTYVYGKSVQYDYWENCNPEGFQYDENYTDYTSHYDSPYLTGEDRAFIDAYSMTYPHEDRARVMEYALLDGCEEYFESETMQEKLTILCDGIRRAFGWRYYEGTFPWEQYLKESLAYVKEK